jgi:4-hydroxy-tetrahydrodipicolinate synthase
MAVGVDETGLRTRHERFRPFHGVLVPALTPFGADLAVDRAAFVSLCRALLADGAHGLAIFGTTSEASSLALAERQSLLEELVEQGIPAQRLMPGTGACSLPEAVALTRHALKAGAPGVLLLPPFYYKNVPEDGVFAYYAEVIERVGDGRLRVFLYHIPQMSGVPITPALVARLVKAYGPVITGLKDSSGSWESTAIFLREFPDLAIFPASERLVVQGLAAGAAGCISATANFQVAGIRKLIDSGEGSDRLSQIRAVFERYPMIPALKAAIAHRLGQPAWRATRPPLAPLPAAEAAELVAALGESH